MDKNPFSGRDGEVVDVDYILVAGIGKFQGIDCDGLGHGATFQNEG